MNGKMSVFWTAVNWLSTFAAALWLNSAVMAVFGDRAAAVLLLTSTIALFAAGIRFIVLFVKKRTPAEKTPEPASEPAEEPGLQN